MSRIRSLVVATSALVALSATPALAKSAFDGAYVGLQGGYTFVTPDADHQTVIGGDAIATSSTDKNADGFTGGIYAGFGQTFDRFYVGAEVDAGYSDAKGTATPNSARYSFEAKESYGVSGRVGYLFSDTALVYGRVGWQRTDIDFTGNPGVPTIGGTPAVASFGGELDGVRYGIGSEVVVGQNLLLRAEYSYTDYEDFTVTYPLGAGNSRVDAHENLVRAGIAYRF